MALRRLITRSLVLVIPICVFSSAIVAERISDISNTKHNLSTSGPGDVTAVSETQICVFCHTPHAAEAIPNAPLWNRKESGATYTEYQSNSINASDIAATPGGSSKLCLSCHDGTIAIGSVNVANGQVNVLINMTGTGPGGVMPSGAGDNTGFTRNLGTDLTNDHPISFTYDDTLANNDGELRPPSTSPHIANRAPGVVPGVPLENDQVQCTSCHDPHIRDTDPLIGNIKFLRLHRFQQAAPGGGNFNEANDILCVACHDKLGLAWASSAHADPLSANETYSPAGAALREFPADLPVWKASCLNCHDTHAVQGTRRLVREGTDSLSSPKTGGNSALEEACYTCHSSDGGVLFGQGGATFEVPDIKTDFNSLIHMPITNSDQNVTNEIHDVNDSDLLEDKAKFNSANRHVECTDCHNPHRVLKNRLFNNTGATQAGTHAHTAGHTNIASGVLRGSWGVEPVYGSANFDPTNFPINYLEKRGDGGNGASTAVNSNHVTREYQVCLRCHSDYAYLTTPPLLGNTNGGTSPGTNNVDRYTNQAMEFQAPPGHEGEGTSPTPTGAGTNWTTNNHRSWHPVMQPTGRTLAVKNTLDTGNFEAPWNGAGDIGNQTMYCSDCHGSDTAIGTSAPSGGENGNAWGPHGSNNNFILKGNWNTSTGRGNQNHLCFKCHDYQDYTNENNDTDTTGFCCGGGRGNLHAFHTKQLGTIRCNWCHVAVPHGWKNKALLVNLNDVGPEAGGFTTTGNEVSNNGGYDNGPYYMNAMLKIVNFANSGQWSETNCGSTGGQGGQGRDWMRNTCETPP